MRITHKLLIVIIFLSVIVLGYQIMSPRSSEMSQERARNFVEIQLSVTDSIANDFTKRPLVFGLQTSHEYHLQVIVEKFMAYTDGLTRVTLAVPNELKVTEGDVQWLGHDKQKTIMLGLMPTKVGDYLVNATATNLDMNFTTTSTILLKVRDTIDGVMAEFSTIKQQVAPTPIEWIREHSSK